MAFPVVTRLIAGGQAAAVQANQGVGQFQRQLGHFPNLLVGQFACPLVEVTGHQIANLDGLVKETLLVSLFLYLSKPAPKNLVWRIGNISCS